MKKLRVIERGFLGPRIVFEHPPRWCLPDAAVAAMGIKNARAMVAGEIDMVELEFPDLPESERFFRIGTNPEGMRLPVEISLASKNTAV